MMNKQQLSDKTPITEVDDTQRDSVEYLIVEMSVQINNEEMNEYKPVLNAFNTFVHKDQPIWNALKHIDELQRNDLSLSSIH